MFWFKNYKTEYDRASAEVTRLSQEIQTQDANWRIYATGINGQKFDLQNQVNDFENRMADLNALLNTRYLEKQELNIQLADQIASVAKYKSLWEQCDKMSAAMTAKFDDFQAEIMNLSQRLTLSEDDNTDLRDSLSKYEPCFDLEPLTQADGAWMTKVLSTIPGYGTKVKRIALDNKYRLCNQDDMIKIIEWDFIDQKGYIAEFWDCDKFALAFKSRCAMVFGVNQVALVVDWSSAHAYNLIVLPDEGILLYEPQTDLYWNINDHDYQGMYALQNAVILI